MFGELLEHTIRICALSVNLVHCDNDWHLGRTSVSNCLDRLGHDTVICSDDENNNVCRLGTTGSHGGERLVARSINERQGMPVLFDLIGADVLGNSTGLTCNNIRIANLV